MKHRLSAPWVPIAVAATLAIPASPATAADDAQKLFEANKCNNCHSVEKVEIKRKIESEKMAGPDLSEVGKKRQAEWIVQFLKREVDLDEKLHKQEYKGTEKDLEAIAEWLVSLVPKQAAKG